MIAIFEGWISGKTVIAKGPFMIETFEYFGKRVTKRYRARILPTQGQLCYADGNPMEAKTEGNLQAIVNTHFKTKIKDWHERPAGERPEKAANGK